MSAFVKVVIMCDAYDNKSYQRCNETTEGQLDLSKLVIGGSGIPETSALEMIEYPEDWGSRYFPDPSGPGEYRICCPKHNEQWRLNHG